jgi:beta-glucanase (GH16 family)
MSHSRRQFLLRAAASAGMAAGTDGRGAPQRPPAESADTTNSVPAGYRLRFNDEFDDDDVGRINETAAGGRAGAPAWRSRYRHARATVINGEKQIYVDAAYAGRSGNAALGLQPFSIADGVLTISASIVDPALAAEVAPQRYLSGCITSELTFWQQYGYFEIRARMPPGRGFWPAFWLLPKSGTWPPEIDVVEASGARPRGVHLGVIEKPIHKKRPGSRWVDNVVDTTDGFHTYGVEWTAEDVAFFIDGQLQFRSGSHHLHEPMYLLANLAVGSHDAGWIPNPDATTPWPGRLLIDHIRVYARE